MTELHNQVKEFFRLFGFKSASQAPWAVWSCSFSISFHFTVSCLCLWLTKLSVPTLGHCHSSSASQLFLLSRAASIDCRSPLSRPSQDSHTNSDFNEVPLTAPAWPAAPHDVLKPFLPPLLFFSSFPTALPSDWFWGPPAMTRWMQFIEAAPLITPWCCGKWWCMASHVPSDLYTYFNILFLITGLWRFPQPKYCFVSVVIVFITKISSGPFHSVIFYSASLFF